MAWINISGPAAPSGGADAHDSLRKVLGYARADVVDDACPGIPIVRGDVSDEGAVGDERICRQLAGVLARLVSHADGR